jgi:DNA-binding NtrC family response regulator
MRSGKSDLALQNTRVLVVEDEGILAMDLQDLLESHGAIVIGPAATVENALALAGSKNIDCAILDVNVAGKTVFAVAQVLSDQGIPFLFQTGHGDMQALSRDWPGSEVLIKPVSYDRLLSLVARIAGPAALMRH